MHRLGLHRQTLKVQGLRQALGLATSNPSLRSLRFRKSSSSSIPTPLTRDVFISDDYVKVAAAKSTMFKIIADSEGVEKLQKVPVPASVKETDTIPDGYSIG